MPGGVARWIALGFLAALFALLGLAVVRGPRLLRLADVGAGYAAKVVCSCVFVGERELEECRADLPAEFDRIAVERLADARGTRARVLWGLVERRALHDPDTGCALQAAR
jgi:hypothetical protein